MNVHTDLLSTAGGGGGRVLPVSLFLGSGLDLGHTSVVTTSPSPDTTNHYCNTLAHPMTVITIQIFVVIPLNQI